MMYVLNFLSFQCWIFISIYGQNAVKILMNPYVYLEALLMQNDELMSHSTVNKFNFDHHVQHAGNELEIEISRVLISWST